MAKNNYSRGGSREVREAKKAVKEIKRHPVAFAVLFIILAVIIAITAVLWFAKPDLFHKLLGTGEHSFTEWTETKAATCGKSGEEQRECKVCGEKETQVKPATGKHSYNGDDICINCGYDNADVKGEEAGAATAGLSIHFLELGNKETGDSILIKCGDTEVLIDAGSQQSSAATIKAYIDKYCTDNVLEYVISTHADTDHIAGLVGTKKGGAYNGILYQYRIETFIKFDNSDKPLKTASGNDTLYKTYLDAVEYIKGRGTAVYTASQCYDRTGGAQRQYYLDGEARKISINILYNYYYYNSSADENNYSVVTLLTEELESGRRNYLFTGDLEEDGESRMVDYYQNVPEAYKTEYNVLPQVDLYKAGHHGSKTSSTAKLLSVIRPRYVAVCCCCGAPQYTKTNANTFPTQKMLDNVGVYTEKIYVTTLAAGLPEKDGNGNYVSQSYGGFTPMNGTIVFYSSGGRLKLWCSNNFTVLKDTEWFKNNRVWNGK